MVKRAVCVGCNYPSKAYGLAGCVNDAFLIAQHLEQNLGFESENICVLHDVQPGKPKNVQVEEKKRPTRVNILQKLQWLVRSTKPGDVSFFSFSGYGLQVDDIDNLPDEGLDEAILPTDYQEGPNNEYSVIVCAEIHDVLAGIPPNSSVTILMDCDHATSIADVSGTLNGELISGLKETAYCGVKGHTAKVQPAQHRRDIWQDEGSRQVKARPRFQPPMEVLNPRKGRFPTRPAMSRANPVAFCFSASGHGQTAVELQVTTEEATWSRNEEKKQHGVLSWCFVNALKEMRNDCTYLDLLRAVQRQMGRKKAEVPRLDQEVLLTFTPPLSDPMRMKVLQPPQAKPAKNGTAASTTASGKLSMAPPVVPPPPPGYIGGPCLSWPGSPGKSGAQAAQAQCDSRPNTEPKSPEQRPPSPPRFTSMPADTLPAKPNSSSVPGASRRTPGVNPMAVSSQSKSMTALLAPWAGKGFLDSLSTLTNWFSYEPPLQQPASVATPSTSPLVRCKPSVPPPPPEVPEGKFSPTAALSPPRLQTSGPVKQPLSPHKTELRPPSSPSPHQQFRGLGHPVLGHPVGQPVFGQPVLGQPLPSESKSYVPVNYFAPLERQPAYRPRPATAPEPHFPYRPARLPQPSPMSGWRVAEQPMIAPAFAMQPRRQVQHGLVQEHYHHQAWQTSRGQRVMTGGDTLLRKSL